jgi:CRISPR-associated protein Csd2
LLRIDLARLDAKASGKGDGKDTARKRQQEQMRRGWLCANFYDVRTFGAVMSTGDYPSGQVRGPLQLTFARSINPIVPLDLAITRVAITQSGQDKTTEIGRKALVPYGLYRGHGFFVPHFAQQTGFSAEDLEIFWSALQRMWDLDRSSSRGMLALRGVYVFSHEHPLGDAPAHMLFERVQVRRKDSVQTPRSVTDYLISASDADLPAGVTLTRLG